MKTTAPITMLSNWLLAAPPACGSVRLACIDGPAGAGKTTLAGILHAAIPGSIILHMDDIYEGWGQDLGSPLADRISTWILDPWSRGEPANTHKFDWSLGKFGDEYDVPKPEVAILEGCASASVTIRERASLVIWRDADPQIRLARGLARDGAHLGQHWADWQTREALHFQHDQTRSAANVVLDEASLSNRKARP